MISASGTSNVNNMYYSKFFELPCCCRIADTHRGIANAILRLPVQRFTMPKNSADLSKWDVSNVNNMYFSKFF